MTVFKAYLKILNKNKFLVILYTVILIFFAGFNMQNNDTGTSFMAEKPDVLIVNENGTDNVTENFIQYIKKHTTIKEVQETEEARNDALFYRDVNYIIYIPKDFKNNFLKGKKLNVEIKSTGDYQASLAEMLVNRYFNVANIYRKVTKDEETLLEMINTTLEKEVFIEVTSKLDTEKFAKATLFYNFANYSILAGYVFIICFMVSSFKEQKVKLRIMVSSIEYKKFNRQLLFSNSLFAIILWLCYVILSIVLVGDVMFTNQGMFLILNSFVFTISALTLALLIGNLVHNKEAMSGIVNVIALGSSFLCGAFVPTEFLPDFVLKIAHVLPSYYYIYNNDLIASLETINLETVKPIFLNMGILLLFGFVFVVMTNIITKKRNR